MQSCEWEKFEVRVLPVVGRSIFTKVRFKKGSIVCQYGGELIGKRELKDREKLYESDPSFYGSFVFEFWHGTQSLAIDATFDRSVGRLINHSIAKENIIPVKTKMNGVWGISCVALRDIEIGEELFYKYGEGRDHVTDCLEWLKK